MKEKIERYNLLIDSLEISSIKKIQISSSIIKEARELAEKLGVMFPNHTPGYVDKYRNDKGSRLIGSYNGIPVYSGTPLANEIMKELL